jgi:hypothetical protein
VLLLVLPLPFALKPTAVLKLPFPLEFASPTATLTLASPKALEPQPRAVFPLKAPLAFAELPKAELAPPPGLLAFALVPHATLCDAPAVAPPPVNGAAPVALPAQTNCAAAGAEYRATQRANAQMAPGMLAIHVVGLKVPRPTGISMRVPFTIR